MLRCSIAPAQSIAGIPKSPPGSPGLVGAKCLDSLRYHGAGCDGGRPPLDGADLPNKSSGGTFGTLG